MDRELTPKQQTSEAIRQADSILILTGQRPSIDQVAATLALGAVLRKFGKKVTTVISDEVPAGARFLPQPYLESNLDGLRDFIVRVGLRNGEVDKLKYEIEDGNLNIFVSPFAGKFSAGDVSFDYGEFHYDLVIVLGVASYARVDKVFAQNQSVLQHIPIANIDYHRSNEQYGAINLIDSNASGLGEILVALSESLQTGLIDQQIATTILAGIMASTDRFTATHTTSKALTVAAQMMAMGADQQVVVRGLYRADKNDRSDRRDRDRSDAKPRQQQSPAPKLAPQRSEQPERRQDVEERSGQNRIQPQPQPQSQPEPAPQPERQSQPITPEPPAAEEAPVILASPEPTPTPQPVQSDPEPALSQPELEIIHPDLNEHQDQGANHGFDPEAPAVTDPEAELPSRQNTEPQPVQGIISRSEQPEPLINDDSDRLPQPSSPSARSAVAEPHQTAQNPTNNPVFANRLPW